MLSKKNAPAVKSAPVQSAADVVAAYSAQLDAEAAKAAAARKAEAAKAEAAKAAAAKAAAAKAAARLDAAAAAIANAERLAIELAKAQAVAGRAKGKAKAAAEAKCVSLAAAALAAKIAADKAVREATGRSPAGTGNMANVREGRTPFPIPRRVNTYILGHSTSGVITAMARRRRPDGGDYYTLGDVRRIVAALVVGGVPAPNSVNSAFAVGRSGDARPWRIAAGVSAPAGALLTPAEWAQLDAVPV